MGPGTSDQSLFRLQIKFKKIPILMSYYLTKFDEVIQSSFGVIPKIKSANLCKPVDEISEWKELFRWKRWSSVVFDGLSFGIKNEK